MSDQIGSGTSSPHRDRPPALPLRSKLYDLAPLIRARRAPRTSPTRAPLARVLAPTRDAMTSEYERERDRTVQKNEAALLALGLHPSQIRLSTTVSVNPKRRREHVPTDAGAVDRRKSSRLELLPSVSYQEAVAARASSSGPSSSSSSKAGDPPPAAFAWSIEIPHGSGADWCVEVRLCGLLELVGFRVRPEPSGGALAIRVVGKQPQGQPLADEDVVAPAGVDGSPVLETPMLRIPDGRTLQSTTIVERDFADGSWKLRFALDSRPYEPGPLTGPMPTSPMCAG